MRLQLDSNPEAPQARLTRCNVIYALKVMAVNLLGILYPPEVHFHEWYHDQLLLYFGQLQKIAPQFLVRTSSSTANLSHIVKQEKRALTMSTGTSRGTHTRNATTIVLDLPEYPDTEIRFNFSGERFLKFDLFVSILDFMMDLAQEDSSDSLEYTHSSSPNSPLWIFVAHNRNTGISLAYFEVLAILESIARWAVLQQIYREVFFRFIVNREEVATGCVTKPLLSKAWCQGFGRDGQALLREKVNTVSSK